MTLKGTICSSSRTSASLRPMKRLIEEIVFCGLVTAWRLATVPTSLSPDCVNATTEGVVRPPSAFSITVGSPPSSTAMQLLVVPRSIPIVFPILHSYSVENLSGRVADLCLLRKAIGRGAAGRERIPPRARAFRAKASDLLRSALQPAGTRISPPGVRGSQRLKLEGGLLGGIAVFEQPIVEEEAGIGAW